MQDKDKPIIFSMARLDHVKNLTGLAQWFGGNKRLRQLCNLVIVGGIVDPSQTTGVVYPTHPYTEDARCGSTASACQAMLLHACSIACLGTLLCWRACL